MGSAEAYQHETHPLTERDRVIAFQETLAQVGSSRVVELQFDFKGEGDAVQSAASQVIAEAYTDDPALLVQPKFKELTAANTQIDFMPYRTRAGKRSAHGVFFGELVYGDEENPQRLPVAVKPHAADAQRSAAKDYAANLGVQELGMHNLESVGVIMSSDKERTAYSISVLEPEITTLDSVNWDYIRSNPKLAMQIAPTWSQVARSAALIHATGSMHGDFAARNIAWHADGGVFPIDWEQAKLSQRTPRDAEARYELSRTDMVLLFESVVLPLKPKNGGLRAGVDLFKGESDKWAAFDETIFKEYAQTRLAFVEGDARQTAEVKDELAELANSLKLHLKLMENW